MAEKIDSTMNGIESIETEMRAETLFVGIPLHWPMAESWLARQASGQRCIAGLEDEQSAGIVLSNCSQEWLTGRIFSPHDGGIASDQENNGEQGSS
jgi:hypothetical protein